MTQQEKFLQFVSCPKCNLYQQKQEDNICIECGEDLSPKRNPYKRNNTQLCECGHEKWIHGHLQYKCAYPKCKCKEFKEKQQ